MIRERTMRITDEEFDLVQKFLENRRPNKDHDKRLAIIAHECTGTIKGAAEWCDFSANYVRYLLNGRLHRRNNKTIRRIIY